jgi:hypothetical protein
MKKQYISPDMQCIVLQHQNSLLAGSNLSLEVLTGGLDLDNAHEGSNLSADAPLFDDLDLMILQ